MPPYRVSSSTLAKATETTNHVQAQADSSKAGEKDNGHIVPVEIGAKFKIDLVSPILSLHLLNEEVIKCLQEQVVPGSEMHQSLLHLRAQLGTPCGAESYCLYSRGLYDFVCREDVELKGLWDGKPMSNDIAPLMATVLEACKAETAIEECHKSRVLPENSEGSLQARLYPTAVTPHHRNYCRDMISSASPFIESLMTPDFGATFVIGIATNLMSLGRFPDFGSQLRAKRWLDRALHAALLIEWERSKSAWLPHYPAVVAATQRLRRHKYGNTKGLWNLHRLLVRSQRFHVMRNIIIPSVLEICTKFPPEINLIITDFICDQKTVERAKEYKRVGCFCTENSRILRCICEKYTQRLQKHMGCNECGHCNRALTAWDDTDVSDNQGQKD